MLLQIFNGPTPTTAALVAVATGTSIKTLLQVKPGSTRPLKIIEWGISFDAAAAAAPVRVELIEADVAATVTAHVAADLHKLDADAVAMGDPTTDAVSVGTAATGYTASAEGTITAVRLFDAQMVSPAGQYVKQFPLGREPVIKPALFGRIRVHAPATVNAICYVTVGY